MGDTLTPDHRFDAWFEPHTLDKRLAGGEAPLGCYKQFLQQGQERLKRRFEEGTGVPLLLQARSWLVDQVLQRVWREIMADHRMAASLIAVGGYVLAWPAFLDIALLYALVNFVSTVAVMRFFEYREPEEEAGRGDQA